MLHTTTGKGAQRAPTPVSADLIYAALDLGTNNCRLLIASPVEQSSQSTGASSLLKVHDSYSRIVRLGEGVSATGVLSEEAMQRTLDALLACQRKLQRFQPVKMRLVATEACRRAKNAPEFLQRVKETLGLSIDIISTEEEAHLAFLGCSSLLSQGAHRALVFDIGGGSTEIMWIDVAKAQNVPFQRPVVDWLSIGYGVMNLIDKFGGTNFADLAYQDMVDLVAQPIEAFAKANDIHEMMLGNNVQLLSTSGTVTTLAAIHLNLPRYDRARIDGITLPVPAILATIQKLLKMRPSERFNHPCIGSDRVDFIISGCAIFEAISSLCPKGNVTIADRGVREGIILSLMQGV